MQHHVGVVHCEGLRSSYSGSSSCSNIIRNSSTIQIWELNATGKACWAVVSRTFDHFILFNSIIILVLLLIMSECLLCGGSYNGSLECCWKRVRN